MKTVIKCLILLSFTFYISSCEKGDDIDFFNTEFRIGLWINSDRGDTLQFIDNSNLVRKGIPSTYQEYLYRIEGEYLCIKLASNSQETKHAIQTVNQNTVVLGNMYIGIGFDDNSGTFSKK